MCGRVVQKTPLSEIRVLFETVNPVPNAAPTYNDEATFDETLKKVFPPKESRER